MENLSLTAQGVTLHLDPSAQERIAEVLAENRAQALQIAIQGGGCSGFSYVFDLAHELQSDDLALTDEKGKVWVAVDPVSAAYLQGATVRFEDEMWERRFLVDNPNASQTCGCGSSFAPVQA